MRRALLASLLLVALMPLAVPADAVTRTVDSQGKHTATVIGPDGYPIVAYYFFGQGLKVADCADSACTAAHVTLTVVDVARDGPIDMTLGADGNPIIVYASPTESHLRVVKCGNTRCSPELATFTTVRSWFTPDAAIALKANGTPFIAAASRDADHTSALYAIDCSTATCSQRTQKRVSSFSPTGLDTAIGGSALPFITFNSAGGRWLVRCGDAGCSAVGATLTSIDTGVLDSGGNTALMVKSNGNPAVVYRASDSGDASIRLANCSDIDCTSPTITILDTVDASSNAGEDLDIARGASGSPVVAYYRNIGQRLRLATCADASCTNRSTVNITQSGGWYPSVAISKAGHPVVAYQGFDQELKVTDTGPLTGPDGSITGRIVDEVGDPIPQGRAEVFTETDFIGTFSADSDGRYSTGGLSAETYYVFLYNGDDTSFIGWFPEWYPNRPHLRFDQAKAVVIEHLGGTVSGIDAQLEPLFHDMFGSTFINDIGWLRGTGITKGCSVYLFCTDDAVTRGEMAAFLTRGLSLTDNGGGDLFVDDDDSIFENDIDRLATDGITRGCNPPKNDRFCPEDPVIRGAMAAFLVRAMGYSDSGGGDLFVDDDTSVFENDIDRLATAGVTKGCNPPRNDRFCPNDPVTRGAMAAFLHRGLGGGVVFPASAHAVEPDAPPSPFLKPFASN